MDFSFNIEGLDKLPQAAQAAQHAVEEEMATALYASANQVANDYKRSILSGGKSGRVYRRRTVTHHASAPGEAPASDTGRLVNSIHVSLDGALSAVMRVSTLYATLLEFGTRFIAPRPAAQPALEKNRGWITDRLSRALVAAIEKTGK